MGGTAAPRVGHHDVSMPTMLGYIKKWLKLIRSKAQTGGSHITPQSQVNIPASSPEQYCSKLGELIGVLAGGEHGDQCLSFPIDDLWMCSSPPSNSP